MEARAWQRHGSDQTCLHCICRPCSNRPVNKRVKIIIQLNVLQLPMEQALSPQHERCSSTNSCTTFASCSSPVIDIQTIRFSCWTEVVG